jgi:hypothetical protein
LQSSTGDTTRPPKTRVRKPFPRLARLSFNRLAKRIKKNHDRAAHPYLSVQAFLVLLFRGRFPRLALLAELEPG